MPDLIGKSLGPYRLIEQIGAGGMATVYKAYQSNLDRYVAVKILPPALAFDEQFARRFQREARALTRLEHAHILPIYDHGYDGDVAYLVMRYIETGTLRDLMDRGSLSWEQTEHIISQVAAALDHAHRMGIIHRDVKPANILIDSQGDVYLTDFGVAHILEGNQPLTDTGVGIGTPAYMSPEQGQGLKVDQRADIYALGIVLYEMLTGRVPFQAETPLAIILKHMHEALPLPRAVNPRLSEATERVILKALSKNPADRFQTAGELAQALGLALRQEADAQTRVRVPAPEPASRVETASTPGRLRGSLGRVALVIIALCALVVGGIWVLSAFPYNVELANGEVHLVAWQTPFPTLTPTLLFVATPTPAPATARTMLLPSATLTPSPTPLLVDAGDVVRSESFDDLSNVDFSLYGVGKAEIVDGKLILSDKFSPGGRPWEDGESAGRSNFSPLAGHTSTFLFKAEDRTYFGFHFELYGPSSSGEFYKGINLQASQGGLYLNFFDGLSAHLGPPHISWPVIRFRYGVWYYYSLRVDPDGLITAQIREKDNPDNIIFDKTVVLNPEWAAPGFTFVTTAYQGSLVLDEYQETEPKRDPSTLFEEDFEDGRADGFNYIGSDWKVVEDENENRVYQVDTTADNDGPSIEFGSMGWTDYAVSYRVRLLNAKADVWLNFRNSRQGTYVERLSLRYGHAGLYISPGGDPWQPLIEPSYHLVQNKWYRVRVEVKGETISVFVDDQLVMKKTDSRLSAGNLTIGNLGNTLAQFDDIRVSALSSAANPTPTSTPQPTTTTALSSACAPVPAGLVGWWPGEGNAKDIAKGTDGQLHGGAGFAPGKVGQAFSFDGIDGSVDVPRSPSLDVHGQVSVEFWMKPALGNPMRDCCQGLVGTDYYLIEIDNASTNAGVAFVVNFKNTREATGAAFEAPQDVWSHIVGVYDRKWLRLYVNGKQEALVDYRGGIPSMLDTSFLSIGSEDGRTICSDCVGNRYFEGLIDEVSIYNTALSANEVQAIYLAGSAGKCFPAK